MNPNRRLLLSSGMWGLGALYLNTPVRALTALDIFPVVETAQGRVRGVASGGINMFKGVHYGANTGGKNRFMPPLPPPKWSGVRDCIEYGPIAPQLPGNRSVDYTGLIMFDIQ